MKITQGIEKMIRPKFYLARRDTRWDVYPQREPLEIVAHDYYGFWARSDKGFWFKSPTSYVLQEQITEDGACNVCESWCARELGHLDGCHDGLA
jgi:hypothetical protein